MFEKKPYGMERSEIQGLSGFELLRKNSYRKYLPLSNMGVGGLWVISTRCDSIYVERFSGMDSEHEAYWVRMKASESRKYYVINFCSKSAYLNLKQFKFGDLNDCFRDSASVTWCDLYDVFEIPDDTPEEILLGVRKIISICYPILSERLDKNEIRHKPSTELVSSYNDKIIMLGYSCFV